MGPLRYRLSLCPPNLNIAHTSAIFLQHARLEQEIPCILHAHAERILTMAEKVELVPAVDQRSGAEEWGLTAYDG